MVHQVSQNVRYLLWTRRVPRVEWAEWLARRLGWSLDNTRALLLGRLTDAELTERQLNELAQALGWEEGVEELRFAELARAGDAILTKNLRFLFDTLGHGGKKGAAAVLGIDPTTISRWLSGAYEPHGPVLRQLVSFFGLPPETDLREDPVFLSPEPVALAERRRWVHERIEALSAEEFKELYPALRRLLEER